MLTWLDYFYLSCYLDELLVVPKIAADYRPLVDQAILDLRVPSVQIKELKRIGLLTLLFDEGLRVEDLVQLAIQLVPIALKLIRLGPHVLVNVVKRPHQVVVDLLGDLSRILLDMLHLGHDLLKFVLDDALLLCEGDIFGHGF